MTDVEVGIKVTIKDRQQAAAAMKQTSTAVEEVGTKSTKATGLLGRFSQGIKGMTTNAGGWMTAAKGMIGAYAGIEAIQKGAEFLKSSTEAAIENESAQRKLAIALKNSVGATKEQSDGVGELLGKLSEQYGVSKDELLPAYQRLAESTGSLSKAHKELNIALDVSAGTGKNLNVVSAALMKANNGTTASLSRLGLKTSVMTKNTVGIAKAQLAAKVAQIAYTKAVAKHGVGSAAAQVAAQKLALAHQAVATAQTTGKKTTLTLDQALAQMSKTFKGQAEAKANSFEGKVARLHETIHELQVKIGNGLIPIISKVADFIMSKGIPALEKMTEQWKSGEGPIGRVHDVLTRAYDIAKTVFGFLERHKETVIIFAKVLGVMVGAMWAWVTVQEVLDAVLAANPVGLVVIAIAALVTGIIEAYKHSKTFRDIVNDTWHVIAKGATWMWDKVLKPVFKLWLDTWLTVVGAIVHGAAAALGWVPGLGPKLKAAAKVFDTFRDDVNNALDGIHQSKDITVRYRTSGPGAGTTPANKFAVQMAEGGIVRHRVGGLGVTVAEAGHDEAIVPMNGSRYLIDGSGVTKLPNVAPAAGPSMRSSEIPDLPDDVTPGPAGDLVVPVYLDGEKVGEGVLNDFERRAARR